jgi:ubiquinone biosynthesis protein Coq4
MTTQEVANRFSELAQEGKFEEILTELFADNAKSIESAGGPFESVEGLGNIIAKTKKFHEIIEEMHSEHTSQVMVAGNYFTCTMNMDVTMKGIGRIQMEEVAVYKVENGKIVSEQFFF